MRPSPRACVGVAPPRAGLGSGRPRRGAGVPRDVPRRGGDGASVQHVRVPGGRGFFTVLAGTGRSQAAAMVLRPGQSTGGEDNVHASSDQWLYVVSGAGRAVVGGRTLDLGAGSLLLIEAGEPHEITNTGREPLVTVNVYAPPAY